MEGYKRARTPARTTFTRILNEIKAELGKVDPETPEHDLLEINLKNLENAFEKLQTYDQQIKDIMIESESTPEEFEAEEQSVVKYSCEFTSINIRVKRIIQSDNLSSTQSEVSNTTAGGGDTKKRNFKLPKITIKKFDGDLKSWLGWWAHLSKIDDDDSLHATDKFQYLLEAVEGSVEAKEIVESFPQSSENYPKAIAAMKDRYGDKNLLIQVYVRELLKLTINNVMQKDTIKLSRMYVLLESHLRSLESLQLAAADPSTWLYPLVESSLPEDVLRAWQRSEFSKKDGKSENPPKSSLDYLLEFIKLEVASERKIDLAKSGFQEMEISDKSRKQTNNQQREGKKKETSIPTAAGLFSGHKNSGCIFCDKNHESGQCGRAINMSLSDKNQKIQEKNACLTCLRTGHGAKKCKVFVKCICCEQRHMTLMCPKLKKTSLPSSSSTPNVATTTDNLNCTSEVLLQTINVILESNGKRKLLRVLLDTGAQKSYLKKGTAEELELVPTGSVQLCHYLFGGSSEVRKHNKFRIQLKSEKGPGSATIEVLDQVKICGAIPRMTTGPWMKELKEKNIWISDLGSSTPDIELLIGSDHYGSIVTGKIHQLQNGLTALQTIFGWTLSGKVHDSTVAMQVSSLHVRDAEVSDLWDLEVIGIRDPAEHKSKEEKEKITKENFLKSVTRSQDGRYCVRLPWISEKIQIPNNKSIAEARLKNATRKLRDQGQYKSYDEVFKGWLQEGIIEEVFENEDKLCHYLPHRPVFKPNSMTTPVRPVFDASCKSKRSPSLNDCLEKGPNLLELIPSILLRFRENRIGVTSDVRKAFQMIDVDIRDRDFLRFLWWEEEDQKTKIFRHGRVVFGVNSSPFLLAAVLENHLTSAPDEQQSIALQLLKSLYVDNCVTSVHSIEEYQKFREVSTQLLSDAKMEIRQWECGPTVDLHSISTRNYVSSLQQMDRIISPVLGLMWNKAQDTLGCDLSFKEKPEIITKRKILSVTHQIFDPIGFTAPALIQPKLLLQDVCAAELSWDDEVNPQMKEEFLKWYDDTDYFSKLQIPRWLNQHPEQLTSNSIHTFCDASKKAFAAVVFLRSETSQGTTLRFLQAKSRVAPIKRTKQKSGVVEKRTSITRLELLSCTIGARLTTFSKKALDWNDIPCYYWTDSTTALAWIQRNDDWGTFVGNRVKEIINLTNPTEWRHVPGIYNPADLPSRGCTPKQLFESRWWEGPKWLLRPSGEWPVTEAIVDEEKVREEIKKTTRTLASITSPSSISNPRFSNYLKNIRIHGWVIRFCENLKSPPEQRKKTTFLSISEIRTAEKKVLMEVQQQAFPNGPKDLNIKVHYGPDGVLRVNSKLLNKTDTEDFRKPIVLPTNHPLVTQLIQLVHVTNCHAGPQAVLGILREKYWILQIRRSVQKVIRKCVKCRRHDAKPLDVESTALPQKRVEVAETFNTTGVDLAGPFFLNGGRKVWCVLFTCALYRSVHLDLVTSLSTEAFVAALERFILIRGRPNTIFSDNGTNFVGTVNLFTKINQLDLEKSCNVKMINWVFNPPSAPWWGGWWERLVRSVKGLLKRTLGRSVLTYDELRTCLSAAEATINNRPLTTVTADQDDLIPLTPAMFLRGVESNHFPENELITGIQFQQRYKRIQSLKKQLQIRFRKEYLAMLVQKAHENKTRTPQLDDIVMVGADNKKRFEWPIGRIIELIPGKDGHIRTAKIKTANGILIRPLQRLYPLEISHVQDYPVLPEVKEQALEEKIKSQAQKNQSPMPEVEPIRTRFGRKVIPPPRYGHWNIY